MLEKRYHLTWREREKKREMEGESKRKRKRRKERVRERERRCLGWCVWSKAAEGGLGLILCV